MSKNTFAVFAETKRPLIDNRLKGIFKQQRILARKQSYPYYELLTELGKLVGRGGKRMRPLLTILAYESYGGRRTRAIAQVAASQELLHTFFLVHDDIIDRDYHRWGGHNILGMYFDRYSRSMPPRDALHAAEAQALLAGDVCVAMANDTLAGSGFDAQKLLQAQRMQQQTVLTVIGGEASEATYPYGKTMPSEAQILQLYRDKTASYSLGLPLRLGAFLADAPHKDDELLLQFANCHGVAFQLQDDILGMFGDERKTGKPTLSDLREGKRTVLIIKALELAKPADRRRLLKLLGDDLVDDKMLKEAQKIVVSSGARDYVDMLIHQYTERSLEYLIKSSMSEAGKRKIVDLIALLANRDR